MEGREAIVSAATLAYYLLVYYNHPEIPHLTTKLFLNKQTLKNKMKEFIRKYPELNLQIYLKNEDQKVLKELQSVKEKEENNPDPKLQDKSTKEEPLSELEIFLKNYQRNQDEKDKQEEDEEDIDFLEDPFRAQYQN